MRTKIKICGITTRADVGQAIACGCDAVGFVFYKRSPRYVSPRAAAAIIAAVPAGVERVGVFVNARERTVRQVARRCGLTMVQFHGDESPAFCRRFRGWRIIKALRVRSAGDISQASRYRTSAVLFDTFSADGFGGTGRRFDWNLLRRANVRQTVFLSGGLTPATVAGAVRLVKPAWVDVSSGVERSPGRKDARKIRAFVRAVKRAEKHD
ncbi:MAG TPA: phosphoribosylanthranilate isomerase [Candidatus Omnitrophota bacterium]|nr:phosphoribosylanthranilate isomerase [Candidatus Omnitrophota bacterium]HRZ14976.1 phosphoribosylanthranilate isomerase [Candidatus Omnitrophota bacterium]